MKLELIEGQQQSTTLAVTPGPATATASTSNASGSNGGRWMHVVFIGLINTGPSVGIPLSSLPPEQVQLLHCTHSQFTSKVAYHCGMLSELNETS